MAKFIRILCPLILIAAGVLFIVQGVNFLNNRKEYLPATGTITDIRVDAGVQSASKRYYVFIDFDIDGKTRESVLYEYNSEMEVGKSIDILYDPSNPDIIVQASNTGDILYIFVGIICIIVACGLVFFQIRSIKKEKESQSGINTEKK